MEPNPGYDPDFEDYKSSVLPNKLIRLICRIHGLPSCTSSLAPEWDACACTGLLRLILLVLCISKLSYIRILTSLSVDFILPNNYRIHIMLRTVSRLNVVAKWHWSRQPGSNRHTQRGRMVCYHYIISAYKMCALLASSRTFDSVFYNLQNTIVGFFSSVIR